MINGNRMGRDFNNFSRANLGINSMVMHDYQRVSGQRALSNAAGPVGMTPHVIEERQMNAVAMSVFDRLMMDRIIFLGMPIDDTVANVINAQLLFLESVDSKKDVHIYLNSPGGSVYSGLGIYDVMSYLNPDIATINTGMAASLAAVLLCAGTKGKRSALKHSRTMIHQPSSGMQGTMSDMEISLKEGKKLKKELYEIISLHSGQDYKKIEKDSDRDYWMTSAEAEKYGLIDKVLSRR